jgi:hypothetical protein
MEVILMKSVRLLLAASFVLILASCALSPTWSIDGKWQQVDGTEAIEFSKPGKVLITSGDKTISAHFEFLDAKHIKIDMGSLGSLVDTVSISKNELTLTNPDGEVKKYRRVR